MTPRSINLNLNDTVRVKLTDHGREILQEYEARFLKYGREYIPPTEDAEGREEGASGMLSFDDMQEIVGSISYRPGWSINLSRDGGGRLYVQVAVSEESEASMSPFTGQREAWKSGKVYLSPFMCRQEIVGAVFGVIRGAEEHEMREWFRYRGASIYNPHLDPDALVSFAMKLENFNFRQNAMSMDEPTKTEN